VTGCIRACLDSPINGANKMIIYIFTRHIVKKLKSHRITMKVSFTSPILEIDAQTFNMLH
jgi:hypothetical protein